MANENFRKFLLNSGKEIIAGKNSDQNDLVVDVAGRNDILLHTKEPGSPFVNLGEKPEDEEIKEGAIFCALKSQDFRDNNRDVRINVFTKSDCFKDKSMKSGTWGVKGYSDTINVSKIDILRMKHDIEEDN